MVEIPGAIYCGGKRLWAAYDHTVIIERRPPE